MKQNQTTSRRSALTLGAAALAFAPRVKAAELSAQEKSNVQLVNDFCATWAKQDVDKILSYFADNAAYRVTETQEPNKGKAAVTERIKSFANRVKSFDVLDTYAKGPMVINERIDYFTGGQLKSWHGVGVFFLKDGKIVEWYDYTIKAERA